MITTSYGSTDFQVKNRVESLGVTNRNYIPQSGKYRWKYEDVEKIALRYLNSEELSNFKFVFPKKSVDEIKEMVKDGVLRMCRSTSVGNGFGLDELAEMIMRVGVFEAIEFKIGVNSLG